MKTVVALMTVIVVLSGMDGTYRARSPHPASTYDAIRACPYLDQLHASPGGVAVPEMSSDETLSRVVYFIKGSGHSLIMAVTHLSKLPGVVDAKIDLPRRRVEITCSAGRFNHAQAMELLNALGLTAVELPVEAEKDEPDDGQPGIGSGKACPFLNAQEVTRHIRTI